MERNNTKSKRETVNKNNVLANYPDVFTPDDVMALFSIGRNTVYNILKSGELPSIKVGKQYRIPKKYILQYMYPCYNEISIDG